MPHLLQHDGKSLLFGSDKLMQRYLTAARPQRFTHLELPVHWKLATDKLIAETLAPNT